MPQRSAGDRAKIIIGECCPRLGFKHCDSKSTVESTDLRNGLKEKAFGERLDAEKEIYVENYF